ncbi:hypothetical protein SAMN04489761_0606 [Tenacibaculum sp. MAR_2009_124]|uniref:luciferase domain-containing protein n=1 Tax=Tenacibaculum sp. MAR_2009_124 TaxID=1250059 RepID=UPI0008945634|nr:luciferase family protein [Tenacibaculum sp. MAR_2009_124]SEB42079.1 hypothetical protein SAMN04489761_0606 [Tenacibaculum sp. MAR_2009_124]
MKFNNLILSGFLVLLFLSSCSNDDPITQDAIFVEVPDTEEEMQGGMESEELPPRCDLSPETTTNVPHHQIGVQFVPEVNEELFRRVYSLPGIENRQSVVGEWRGMWLTDDITIAVPDALISGREFGHIHDDGSLHIFLEPSRANETVTACWGIFHPFAVQQIAGWDGFVMLYTPQSIDELSVTFQLIVDGYNYVTGQNLIATNYY